MDETRALALVKGYHALVVGLSAISFQLVLLEAVFLLGALVGARKSPLFATVMILLGLGFLAYHLHWPPRVPQPVPHHRTPSAASITRWRLAP